MKKMTWTNKVVHEIKLNFQLFENKNFNFYRINILRSYKYLES